MAALGAGVGPSTFMCRMSYHLVCVVLTRVLTVGTPSLAGTLGAVWVTPSGGPSTTDDRRVLRNHDLLLC